MSEPIINPLILYLFNVLPNIQFFLEIIITIVGAGICTYIILRLADVEGINLSKLKKPLIVMAIMTLLAISIPSEKTMLTMYVASLTTSENIEKISGSVEDTVDYIVEKIQELEEEGE